MRKIALAVLAAALLLPIASQARDHGNRGWDRHDRGHHYGRDRIVIVNPPRAYQPFLYDCGGYYARSCYRPVYVPRPNVYYAPPTYSFGINIRN